MITRIDYLTFAKWNSDFIKTVCEIEEILAKHIGDEDFTKLTQFILKYKGNVEDFLPYEFPECNNNPYQFKKFLKYLEEFFIDNDDYIFVSTDEDIFLEFTPTTSIYRKLNKQLYHRSVDRFIYEVGKFYVKN